MTDIDIGAVVATLLAVYALGIGVFLISENRAPQATLAWMLAFILAPGLGVLIYLLWPRWQGLQQASQAAQARSRIEHSNTMFSEGRCLRD